MNIKLRSMMSQITIVMFFVALYAAIPANAADEASGMTQELQGFNLNGYTNDGKKSWEVNGKKADISDDKIKVTDVDANFYGKEKANLKSDTGTINKTSGEVHLQDNVVVKADRGTTMTTDTLDWNRNKDVVSTKDKVKIVDDQGTITGKGMTAHPNLKNAQLDEDVKAVINTKSKSKTGAGQTVTITSDGPMSMDQAKMYAVFTKNVVASEPATGRELHADKMEVWFDEQNKKIKKVVCSGNVEVIQGGNASYAEEMVYSGEDQLLTMTGRPKIVFDTGDKQGSGMFQQLGK